MRVVDDGKEVLPPIDALQPTGNRHVGDRCGRRRDGHTGRDHDRDRECRVGDVVAAGQPEREIVTDPGGVGDLDAL